MPPDARRRQPRWVREERVLWRAGPGFVVLLGPENAAPMSLRGTGVALWAAVRRPRTVTEIVATLAAQFEAEPDLVRADVEPAIAQLASAGALRAVS